MIARVKRQRWTRAVKRVISKANEPKHVSSDWSLTQCYHNRYTDVTGLVFLGKQLNAQNAGTLPAQGTNDNQRVGDMINIKGFKIKLLFGQKAAHQNLTWKWFIMKVPKGAVYSYTSWFKSITSNVLLDDPNDDFVKVLKRGVIKDYNGDVGDEGKEYTFTRTIWLPYRKLLKFGPASSALTHNDDDLWFMCAPYDAYGTLDIANVGYFQMSSTIYYSDP